MQDAEQEQGKRLPMSFPAPASRILNPVRVTTTKKPPNVT